jgi:DNA-binding GntR family transcriptional regulator
MTLSTQLREPAPAKAGARTDAADSSLNQRVYARLRDEIITCELPPGVAFSEGALAESFGVGKAPVRWALAALTREELVVPRARQGYTVAPITLQAVRDLFDLRLMLEPSAAGLAAGRMTRAHLEALDRRIERSRPLVGKGPKGEFEFLRANTAFHKEIALASGNARLARVLAAALDESERIFYVSMQRWVGIRGEHRAILEALVSGNALEAERLCTVHVQRTYKIILDAILERAAILDVNVDALPGPRGGA